MRLFRVLLWETFRLRLFGMAKVPLLGWCLPAVTRLDDEACGVLIPLRRRTKNHLGSMYFGTLCVGADCAGGLMAYRLIEKSGKPVSLIFKDFKAEFLKRAEGDVEFTCTQGREIAAFVQEVLATTERRETTVRVEARVPRSSQPEEVVARFELTLSLKNRGVTSFGRASN
jgi:acyl-coenzyme A thioesterase PaaI-like protein